MSVTFCHFVWYSFEPWKRFFITQIQFYRKSRKSGQNIAVLNKTTNKVIEISLMLSILRENVMFINKKQRFQIRGIKSSACCTVIRELAQQQLFEPPACALPDFSFVQSLAVSWCDLLQTRCVSEQNGTVFWTFPETQRRLLSVDWSDTVDFVCCFVQYYAILVKFLRFYLNLNLSYK